MQVLTHAARRVGLVLGLLLLFLSMMSFQVNRDRTLSSARGLAFLLASPLQRLAGAALGGVASVWNGYFDLTDAAGRAAQLESEVAALRRQLAALQEARRENERLRALVGLDSSAIEGSRAAPVVARDLEHRFETVTIGRGGADGVTLDAPVIAPNGAVVGRVVQLARWTAMVQLITDPLSGVGGRLTGSRATGLVAGTDGPHLRLQFVESINQIADRETVVTSGEDGIYPPGLLLGTVRHVASGTPVPGTPRIELRRQEAALFRDIEIAPGVDVLSLETVLVLPRREGS